MSKKTDKQTLKVGDLSLTCREAVRLQSQSLERPLSLTERVGLKIHLALCRWCKRYGIQIRFLRSVAQKLSDLPKTLPTQSLSPEARDRMKQKLRTETNHGSNN